MTLSSGSTSNRHTAPWGLVGLQGLALCVLALGAGGCASKSGPAPHVVHGYADLAVLIRRQPGWSGLAQYDAALARLDLAARNLPQAGQPDPKMAILPALSPEAAVDPKPVDVNAIAQRLNTIQGTLIGSLDDRRRMARADQIRRQQELWRREARQLFPIPERTAAISSDLDLQLLQANVVTLTRTLDHWDTSVPPTPVLDRLKVKVEADRSRLEALIAGRIQTRDAARTARLEEIRHLRQARTDYVKTQGDMLAARLEADDARIVSAQQRRLSDQRVAVLEALARPEPIAVSAAGSGGTLSLPNGPGMARASLSAGSLLTARAGLVAQRARWAEYLTSDTRASALDAAAQHHWNITFGPPRRGDRDMTAALEQALVKG